METIGKEYEPNWGLQVPPDLGLTPEVLQISHRLQLPSSGVLIIRVLLCRVLY